ncbi:MAG: DUF805 domain-containing protein [bacterium]|nr:DUF805 domain-containing protein [bacterium]
MHYYISVLKKYTVFSGRAGRAEFWYFFLYTVLISIGIDMFSVRIWGDKGVVLGLLYGLAVFLPTLGVTMRRLHDVGKSGWWVLISYIPIVGTIVVIVFLARDSQPGDNHYGPNPKGILGSIQTPTPQQPSAVV